MRRFLIGAGGWAYFQVPGMRSLEAYSSAFDFVEVNSTFYELPSPRLVEAWRRTVPSSFEFSVRCHRDVTHKFSLQPVEKAFKTFRTTIDICEILNSKILVLQTPKTLLFDDKTIKSVTNFFGSVNQNRVRIVLEIRNSFLPKKLLDLMQDYAIVHCTDLSKETPAYDSDLLYSRLFGKGINNIYQFTDDELRDIDDRATNRDYDQIILSFHGVKMYKDAARLEVYKKTDVFPKVTNAIGKKSLMEVLVEDTHFPITKQELLVDQGWKVIDLESEKRVHAHFMLKNLPERTFANLEEVFRAL